MIAEHFIYSAALAILVGMVFYQYTRRDPSWIIIICALVPDLDVIANRLLTLLGFKYSLKGTRSPMGHFTILQRWFSLASSWHFYSALWG